MPLVFHELGLGVGLLGGHDGDGLLPALELHRDLVVRVALHGRTVARSHGRTVTRSHGAQRSEFGAVLEPHLPTLLYLMQRQQ